MQLYKNDKYIEDVRDVSNIDIPWEMLRNKSVVLSGATGLIGSFFVDVILEKNLADDLNCTIYALARDENKAKKRFFDKKNDNHLIFIPYDVRKPLKRDDIRDVNYIIHLASNTHPLQYATDPIGTITTNVIGLQNMLEFAVLHKASRFVFASSNEIYGENRGDEELFKEDYCGYINSNTLRAGYPESKRCGEALCQAYMVQKGMETVVARFTRSYGPTMLLSDTKAISQFIKNGLNGENIILKSLGNQYYSYTYVADAVSGLLTVLLKGEGGEAYNIAHEESDIKLKDLASFIAQISRTNVVFEIPDKLEATGYSTASKARLDGTKLQRLGWEPRYSIKLGIKRTFDILKSIR